MSAEDKSNCNSCKEKVREERNARLRQGLCPYCPEPLDGGTATVCPRCAENRRSTYYRQMTKKA